VNRAGFADIQVIEPHYLPDSNPLGPMSNLTIKKGSTLFTFFSNTVKIIYVPIKVAVQYSHIYYHSS